MTGLYPLHFVNPFGFWHINKVFHFVMPLIQIIIADIELSSMQVFVSCNEVVHCLLIDGTIVLNIYSQVP